MAGTVAGGGTVWLERAESVALAGYCKGEAVVLGPKANMQYPASSLPAMWRCLTLFVNNQVVPLWLLRRIRVLNRLSPTNPCIG